MNGGRRGARRAPTSDHRRVGGSLTEGAILVRACTPSPGADNTATQRFPRKPRAPARLSAILARRSGIVKGQADQADASRRRVASGGRASVTPRPSSAPRQGPLDTGGGSGGPNGATEAALTGQAMAVILRRGARGRQEARGADKVQIKPDYRVSGTKRTANALRVTVRPSRAFVMTSNSCRPPRGPTGMTSRPPGASWSTSGCGT